MQKETKLVLNKAIATFGRDKQTDVAIEEMAELINAICKYRRGRVTTESIAEEIADVEIMLEQLCQIYNCEESVKVWRRSKIDRLEKALDM